MLEKNIEQYLRRQAKQYNIEVFKFVSPANRGVPDNIVIWWDGDLDFVELKTETGKLTALQIHNLTRLTNRKQNCYVLYGKADVDRYIAGELEPWSP